MISNAAMYWAIVDFVWGFLNIGVAVKTRNSRLSIINWSMAGLMIIMGILQLMGRL